MPRNFIQRAIVTTIYEDAASDPVLIFRPTAAMHNLQLLRVALTGLYHYLH